MLRHIVGNRVRAEVELARDVVVASAACEPGEDFKLAGCQGGADLIRVFPLSAAMGMPRSRMRCRSLPAIWEEITDSPAAVP